MGKPVVVLDDEDKTLSRYGVQKWQCIKVRSVEMNDRAAMWLLADW
jgi:hypothetical protein